MAVPGNVYVSKRPPRKYPWLRCIRTIICGECGWVPVGKSHKEVNYTIRPRKNDSNIFNGIIIISYMFIRKKCVLLEPTQTVTKKKQDFSHKFKHEMAVTR